MTFRREMIHWFAHYDARVERGDGPLASDTINEVTALIEKRLEVLNDKEIDGVDVPSQEWEEGWDIYKYERAISQSTVDKLRRILKCPQ